MILPVAGCQGAAAAVERVVDDYIHAVQERDHQRLLSLSAPMVRALAAAPAGQRAALQAQFLKRLDERQAAYLSGRDAGQLPFGDDGIVLLRALKLGRGAYYENVDLKITAAGQASLLQEVRLAYRSMPLDDLPLGTTIYLLGEPLGTVYHPVIGRHRPAVRRLLERVWVRWNLVHEADRWLVQSVGPAARPPLAYDDTTRF